MNLGDMFFAVLIIGFASAFWAGLVSQGWVEIHPFYWLKKTFNKPFSCPFCMSWWVAYLLWLVLLLTFPDHQNLRTVFAMLLGGSSSAFISFFLIVLYSHHVNITFLPKE